MKIKIVEFTIELYDDVIALWERCEGVGLSSADSKESITVYLERNRGMSFVAIEEDRLVGAVLCGHDGRRGYIHHLAVDPGFRKKGIGSQLEASCLKALKRVGIEKCHLFTFKDNRDGQCFWGRLGWTTREEIVVNSKGVTGS